MLFKQHFYSTTHQFHFVHFVYFVDFVDFVDFVSEMENWFIVTNGYCKKISLGLQKQLKTIGLVLPQ